MEETKIDLGPDASLLRRYLETSLAILSVIGCVAGAIIYIAGVSSRADAAFIKYEEVDRRLDRQKDALLEQREFGRQMLDRTSRMEGKIDVILQKMK